MMYTFQTLIKLCMSVCIYLFTVVTCRQGWQSPLIKTCAFEWKSWWNISGCKSRDKKTMILCSCSACTRDPICSPGWIMPPVIQTTSNWGDSHLHHEQTQGKWCRNSYAHKHYTLFLLLHAEKIMSLHTERETSQASFSPKFLPLNPL